MNSFVLTCGLVSGLIPFSSHKSKTKDPVSIAVLDITVVK